MPPGPGQDRPGPRTSVAAQRSDRCRNYIWIDSSHNRQATTLIGSGKYDHPIAGSATLTVTGMGAEIAAYIGRPHCQERSAVPAASHEPSLPARGVLPIYPNAYPNCDGNDGYLAGWGEAETGSE